MSLWRRGVLLQPRALTHDLQSSSAALDNTDYSHLIALQWTLWLNIQMSVYDVIVVGLGAHGAAAAYHLAKRGQRVLALEKYAACHGNGSSHGYSRIIRLAYYEDSRYVPLLKRSFELFRSLEQEHARLLANCGVTLHPPPLLTMTGGLMIGRPDSEVVTGTLQSAREHQLEHKLLTPNEVAVAFPAFSLAADEVAVHESEAGYLNPEACILAHLRLAEAHGAELHFQEEVISWEVAGEGRVSGEERMVRVSTAKGEYQCRRLVLSVGAWAPEIYGRDLQLPFTIERRVLLWLDPAVDHISGKKDGQALQKFKNGAFPIYLWEYGTDGSHDSVYGFPHQPGEPGGVKVALHVSSTTPCTPSTIRRDVSPEEVQQVRQVLRHRIPSLADGKLLHTATCMYTSLPDGHFLVCFHPKYSAEVVLVSPCSGHGFKFSSVIGEVVADLVQTGTTRHDISLFLLNRERWKETMDQTSVRHNERVLPVASELHWNKLSRL